MDIVGELFVKDSSYGANTRPGGYFKNILKSIAMAFAVTFIILVIAAIFLCFLDFPEKYTLPSVIIATVLGVLSGSYRSARQNEDRRMISAILTAIIYMILAYIIGCLVQGKVMISSNTALFAAIVLLTGGIASILAGRTGKSQNRFKGGSNLLSEKFKKGGLKSYKFGKNNNH